METDLVYAMKQLQFALDHVSNVRIVEDCMRRANDAIERILSSCTKGDV